MAGRKTKRLRGEHVAPGGAWRDIRLPQAEIARLRKFAAGDAAGSPAGKPHGIVLFAGKDQAASRAAAEAIARESGRSLHRVDLASVVNKHVGETEKNLRAVFDAAETSGAVLLFDEADALFSKRSEVRDSHDRYANVDAAYLLQRLESFDGLAVLATRELPRLTPTMRRRFWRVIEIT